jgi:hypothetical protein
MVADLLVHDRLSAYQASVVRLDQWVFRRRRRAELLVEPVLIAANPRAAAAVVLAVRVFSAAPVVERMAQRVRKAARLAEACPALLAARRVRPAAQVQGFLPLVVKVAAADRVRRMRVVAM